MTGAHEVVIDNYYAGGIIEYALCRQPDEDCDQDLRGMQTISKETGKNVELIGVYCSCLE